MTETDLVIQQFLDDYNKARNLGDREDSVQGRAQTMPGFFNTYGSLALGNFTPTGGKPTAIPEYNTANASRDYRLRRLWSLIGGEVVQAAISASIQKIQTTPWFIEGPAGAGKRVHNILHNADFGATWEQFLSRGLTDYLTQDNGWFVEALGPGPKHKKLEKVTGLANMDAARCMRTGNPEFPVIYQSPKGGRHKMHWSRIYFQADLPSPDETRLGYGFCALSRCISAVQSAIQWSKFRTEMLDDMPAPGMLLMNGIQGGAFQQQMRDYEAGRASKEENAWRALIYLFNPNPMSKIEAQLVSFRQTYEGFEERKMYDLLIDLVAMAFNIDRQELAPLATSALGSGAQSTVLSEKSRGKGVGWMLSMVERMINRLIPESLTFRFDFQDDQQDMDQASIRQMKATTIISLFNAKDQNGPVQINGMDTQRPSTKKKAFAQAAAPADPNDTTDPAAAPVMPPAEGLINRQEARYMLAKEGIIPRELLSDEERLNDWDQFDDITFKSFQRYGPPSRVWKDGKVVSVLDWQRMKASVLKDMKWLA